MQQHDPPVVDLLARDLRNSGGVRVLPIESPCRPIDRGQIYFSARLGCSGGHFPEWWAVPPAANANRILDGRASAQHIISAAPGVDSILTLVPMAVRPDLVAPTHNLVRDVEVSIELTSQHEERRSRADQVERIQDGRSRVKVRAVIEGQDRAPSRGNTFYTRVSLPTGSAARMPRV